jgi:NitT/TauT family transport system ATP-binding protein
MTSPAARVEGLWKAFYDRRRDEVLVALQDVTLEVAENEFVAVLGPSGCGKSTLLRILAGLETPERGTVEVAGRPSVVFQEHGVLPWRTVEANVAYPLALRHIPRAQRRTRVDELLDLVGLTQFRRYYPHQLSGGMRQRTSVARALADDGPLLLMDEPFGALDELTRVGLQEELLRIWSTTNKAVLFITHSVDEALVLADRVLVMSPRPGRFVAEVPVPFGRPRNVHELRDHPDYAAITAEVWRLLDDPETEGVHR